MSAVESTAKVAGVVLAGGQSRRFGRDKAEEYYRGRRLIDWSIDALRPYADPIFVAGRGHAEHPAVSDRPHPGLGPLGGLAGALHAAAEHGCAHVLSLPCDTPILPGDLLGALCASHGAAFLPSCPVIGIWPTHLGSQLETYLAHGENRSVRAWAELIGAAAIEGYAPVANINHVADLVEITRRHD